MAEFNFGLLTPPGSQSIGNAFVTGMNQAATLQQLENQNALAKYTLAKAQREDELTNKMLAGLQGANTIEEQARILRSVGRVKEANDLLTAALNQQKTRTDIAVNTGKVIRDAATTVLTDPTYKTALAAVQYVAAATGQDMSSELAKLEGMKDNPVKIADWARGHSLTGEQLMNANKPLQVAANTTLVNRNNLQPLAQTGAPNPVTGQQEFPAFRAPGATPAAAAGAAPAAAAFGATPAAAAGAAPASMQERLIQAAQNYAIALDKAGLPVNIRVPTIGAGAAPGGANALAGAAPNVNALGANVPLPGGTPRQALEQFQSDLRRREAAEKSERDRVAALERQGFRSLSGGRQERIPGGPADPEALAAQEEGKNLAKLRTEEYKELGKNAVAARKAMPAITTAERILEAGFKTGWGAEVQAAAANILTSLGVPEAKQYATTAQTFLAQARQITNDRLLEQKGTQTENDFKRVEDIGAKLTNTVDANKFLLAVNRAVNNQTIDKHKFFTKWETTHNNLKGAEQAWQDGPGNISLFERPELKAYAETQTPQKPATAPRGGSSIQNQADAILRKGNP